MAKYTVRLMGPLQVTWEGGEPPRFRSQRTMALLGYLAAEGRPVSRDGLAALFWPDATVRKGKASLRRELHNLGKILPGCWQTDRQTVQFLVGSGTQVDVYEVLRLIESEEWAGAAELVRGDFLEGVYLDDSLEFETWLLGERERWRQRAEQVLSKSVEAAEQSGDEAAALRFARRLLQLLPWHEETHRTTMRLLALSGQRSAALKQFEQCRQVLQAELGVEVSAETRALYERIRDSLTFALHNIPAPTTPLIGREEELAQLERWLDDGDVRLVTITGAGGMGKTRLALGLAQTLLERPGHPFTDGVYFVSLASLDDPAHLVSEIAAVLHFPVQGQDRRSPREQLLDYLRQKQMLLLLDNYEHLLPGAELVAEIVKAAPAMHVVATSRERLRLHGEQVFSLHGLDYEDETALLEMDKGQTAAVCLFVKAAERARPDFQLGNGDDRYLSKICRLVEGMPLALELAATWVDTLSLAAIASEIEQGLDFLESDLRGAPERHRSILAVFDTSWRRLSRQEQEVFAGLSVFRGGFSRQAAEAVVAATVRSLSSLVNHSLLIYDGAADRYHIHELLREYAAGRLSEDAEYGKCVNEKHSDYFCHWLRAIGPEIQSVRQPLHETRLVADVSNSERALRWAMKHQLIENLVAAANNLGRLFMRLHRYRDGRVIFREIANLAESGVQRQPEDARWRYLLAIALVWLADFTEIFGEDAPYQAWLGRSIELLESADVAPMAQGDVLPAAYLVLGDTHQDAEAAVYYRHSLSAARAAGNRWAEANALQRLGVALTWRDRDEAYQAAHSSYRLWQELQDMRGMSWAARALAWLALSAGDYDSAEQYAQEGFALSQSLRSTDGIARSAFTLGWVALAQGDFEAAVPYQEMSLSIWQRLGFDHADIDTRLALGLAHMHSGRLQEAQEIADLCRVRADERHREEGVVYSRLLSGMVSLALEQPLRALKELRAIENSVAGDRLAIQAYFCATLARLAVDPSAAAEALADVEAHVDQGISYPLMTARLKVVKAATSAAQGHESAARQLWTEACGQPLIARSQWYAMVIKLVSPALALLT